MSTSIKIRSKLSPYANKRTDNKLAKSISNRTSPNTSKIELSTAESIKLLQTFKESKPVKPINLQIPSFRYKDLSDSANKDSQKKTVYLKGYYSNTYLKTHKGSPNKKEKSKERIRSKESKHRNTLRLSHRDTEDQGDCDFVTDKGDSTQEKLQRRLMKVLKENMRLKRIISEEVSNDFLLDEMMTSFKSRLQKFLYENISEKSIKHDR